MCKLTPCGHLVPTGTLICTCWIDESEQSDKRIQELGHSQNRSTFYLFYPPLPPILDLFNIRLQFKVSSCCEFFNCALDDISHKKTSSSVDRKRVDLLWLSVGLNPSLYWTKAFFNIHLNEREDTSVSLFEDLPFGHVYIDQHYLVWVAPQSTAIEPMGFDLVSQLRT